MIQALGGWFGKVWCWSGSQNCQALGNRGQETGFVTTSGCQLATKGFAPGCSILAVVGALMLGLTLQCVHHLEGSMIHAREVM